MGRKIPKSQIGSTFGKGGQIHLEIVDGKFPVDIVELEFMPILPIFGLFFRKQLSKGIQVEEAVPVDALMDIEMLAVLLLDEYVSAVRAYKGTDLEVGFIPVEPETTDLAHVLASTACIVIEIVMGCTTAMTYSIRRHWIVASGFYWFEILTVLGFVFSKQKNVVEPLRLLDDKEFVNGELVVLGA
jgi:hypothetical protein